MIRIVIGCAFSLNVAIATAQSPGSFPINVGTARGNVEGSFTSLTAEGDSLDVTYALGGAWLFATDRIEVGVALNWIQAKGDSATFLSIGPNYYFSHPNARTPAFAGLRYLHATHGFDLDGIAGVVGAHVFVGDSVSLSPTVSIGRLGGDNFVQVCFGLSYWFQTR
ncbi:MAG: hypothetical protein M5U21_11405 [Fimbriimonadaceae bacterium]|nr:hypothetical protein [Fimbriimonadaceae bacterium]